ncbi:MAG: hypothetical protein KC586_20835, partial [Myxococcales bacterium]|nr:hypothetical protein [Myxococcales bacterium]
HAAAIIKAQKKGDEWLADRVYSGVPAAMFGREQEICIGPMSGISNVTYWLETRGIEAKGTLIKAILVVAKASDHNLSTEEVLAVVDRHKKAEAKEAAEAAASAKDEPKDEAPIAKANGKPIEA